MERYLFAIVIEKDEEGYFASCLALEGCYTQSESFADAMANIRDAIWLHIEDRSECGEPIPIPETVSVTTLEIAA